MNKIKVGIAVLAIVLTAGFSYANQKAEKTNFFDCYAPGSQSLNRNISDCPGGGTECCYSQANSQGTAYNKLP